MSGITAFTACSASAVAWVANAWGTASGVVLCGVPRSPDLPRKCGIRAEERRKAWVRESRDVIAAAEAVSHDDGVGTHDEGELSGHERQVVLLGL